MSCVKLGSVLHELQSVVQQLSLKDYKSMLQVYKAMKDGVQPVAVKVFPQQQGASSGLQRMRTGARFQDPETTQREVGGVCAEWGVAPRMHV